MEDQRKRHCWECRRRCLVCDSTEPACRRCSRSGTVCPGYSHAKPVRLRWLAPGRVKARPRRLAKADSTESDSVGSGAAAKPGPEPAETMKHGGVPCLEIMETCVLFQAAEYFNTCIYPDLIPINQLGRNPHIFPILPWHLRRAAMSPQYLPSVMVCMALSHRINRTRDEHGPDVALSQKFYAYRGNVIRSLSQHLDQGDKPPDDIVIAVALMLLLVDVQHGTSLNWRWHLEGVQRMITLRGGYSMLTQSKGLESLLISFWFIAVLGNTTCPAAALSMTESHLSALDLIMRQYKSTVSPLHLCPLPLFAELIKINHLRRQGLDCTSATADSLSHDAHAVLHRVRDFCPGQWAQGKPSFVEAWTLVGHAYQAAVDLYCVFSLQSSSVLPETSLLRAQCTATGQRLQGYLREALSLPQVARFMLWPLVLLGVEAASGRAAMRAFVTEQLLSLSRGVGSYTPLTAKGVLEAFWASGARQWDDCFREPYVFTTQIALDTSQIARPS